MQLPFTLLGEVPCRATIIKFGVIHYQFIKDFCKYFKKYLNLHHNFNRYIIIVNVLRAVHYQRYNCYLIRCPVCKKQETLFTCLIYIIRSQQDQGEAEPHSCAHHPHHHRQSWAWPPGVPLPRGSSSPCTPPHPGPPKPYLSLFEDT